MGRKGCIVEALMRAFPNEFPGQAHESHPSAGGDAIHAASSETQAEGFRPASSLRIPIISPAIQALSSS